MRTTKLFLSIALIICTGLPAFSGSIHLVAGRGDVNEVRRLLDSGVSTEETNIYNCNKTPLMWAARCGQNEVITLLLDRGANIEARTETASVLTEAIHSGSLETVKLLVKRGVDINWKMSLYSQSPLNLAIQLTSPDMVAVYSKTNPSFSTRQSTEIARFLIEQGAKLGASDLCWAAGAGNLIIVQMLLDKGLSANLEGDYLPLIGAVASGCTNVVQLLLDRGADISAKRPYDGCSALSACKDESMRIFLEKAKQEQESAGILYWIQKNDYSSPVLTEKLITVETTQLPDWLSTATVQQKVALLTDIKKQIARATAAIDRLNGEAADAIAKKQDAAPYRARVGQIKAYINVLNEIKAILEQS
jgi:ankyrin repeat protein